VVSNAGGINPHACAKAIHDVAKKSGVEDLKIAVLTGDNLKDKVMNKFVSCFDIFARNCIESEISFYSFARLFLFTT
jgi:hypothetical protein